MNHRLSPESPQYVHMAIKILKYYPPHYSAIWSIIYEIKMKMSFTLQSTFQPFVFADGMGRGIPQLFRHQKVIFTLKLGAIGRL